LYSNFQNDSSYDWVSNLTQQQDLVNKTIKNLPNIKSVLETVGQTASVSENQAPLYFNYSADEMISAARTILMNTKQWISERMSSTSLTKSDVDTYVNDNSANATWLMYAVNDIVINRCTRNLLKWKEDMGDELWNNLYVIVQSGIADGASVVTPRGSCSSGNTSSVVFAQLMTEEHLASHLIMYSGTTLDFDVASSIVNPQSISATLAEQFADSPYARMLATDLYQPENALSTQFSQNSAELVLTNCASSQIFENYSKCPFS